MLANVLDYDDGHRITKGHPGAMVIPAALATAEASGADLPSMMEAVAVGYEIAIRAGVRLHERESQYHASGAWGALGAAAAAGRLLGLDGAHLEHAMGLAEYHAPIALIMRSVADPAMTKDATGWGAMLGVTRRCWPSRGTPPSPARSSPTAPDWSWAALGPDGDLRQTVPLLPLDAAGDRGRGGIAAERPVAAGDIDRVTIDTFEAAAQLSERRPRSGEDMQYSLVWPVAVALVDGDFDVDGVLAEFSMRTWRRSPAAPRWR